MYYLHDGRPLSMDRLNQIDGKGSHGLPREPLHFATVDDADRKSIEEGDLKKAASSIRQLAIELEALDAERREGRLSSSELVERFLSVWMAIKEVDRLLNSPDPQA